MHKTEHAFIQYLLQSAPLAHTQSPEGIVRVLIVDDQEFIRRGIRAALSAAPEIYVCGEARDGFDAIQKARELNPDVVLMDISMPNLDGLEGTRELRRLMPHIQIVTVSQYDIPGIEDEAVRAGAAMHVSKLLIWDDLVSSLRTLKLSNDLAPSRISAR